MSVFIACTISLTTAGDIPRETGSTIPVMFVALSSSTGPDSDTMTDIGRRTCTIEISQTWWTMYTVMHIYEMYLNLYVHCIILENVEHCGGEPEQADTGYYVTDE